MKILVTGSSGFIGKNIVKELKLDKTIQVIETTRNEDCMGSNTFFFDIYKCDFTIDLAEYFGLPDMVLHCAWENVKQVNNIDHINNQVFYHIKFLENLAKNGIKRISILGSCFEYGKINGEVDENKIVNPITAYAIAKDFLRRHVQFLNSDNGFIFQWIRIFYTYDITGKDGNNIVHQLKKAIESNDKVFNMSDGKKSFDFLEIGQLSYFIKKIITQDKINGIINCCSGKPQTISNLLESCMKLWEKKIHLNKGFYENRDFEPDTIYGNTSKLRNILQN